MELGSQAICGLHATGEVTGGVHDNSFDVVEFLSENFGSQRKCSVAAIRTHRELVPVDVAGKVLVRCVSECHWESEGYSS